MSVFSFLRVFFASKIKAKNLSIDYGCNINENLPVFCFISNYLLKTNISRYLFEGRVTSHAHCSYGKW